MKKLLMILIFMGFIAINAADLNNSNIYELYKTENLSSGNQEELIKFCDKHYKNVDLAEGSQRPIVEKAKEGGGSAVWFIKAKSGAKVEISANKNRTWPMKEIGNSGYFFAAEKFPNMSAVYFHYSVDGKRFPFSKHQSFGFESYELKEESKKQAGVPAGELLDMGDYTASGEFYPNTVRHWWIYVPAQYKKEVEAKLIVFNDGQSYIKGDGNACIVMDNLIHSGKMPVTIAVFVTPGNFGKESDPANNNRSNEYDTCTPMFATFLEKEILSQVYQKYNVSKKADDHAICGSSSGGSCAFTAAWHRNDLFTRVISFVGSYSDFRPVSDYPLNNGNKSQFGPFKTAHDYPGLIRKTIPNKNIRVFLQDGENDLDNNLGNWYLNNLRMEAALAFSGYKYKTAWGKGIHSNKHGMSILPEIMEWIWQNN